MITAVVLDSSGTVLEVESEGEMAPLGLRQVAVGDLVARQLANAEAASHFARAVALASVGAAVSPLSVALNGDDDGPPATVAWTVGPAQRERGAVRVTAAIGSPGPASDLFQGPLAALAAGVAHEIRNMSAILRGLIELAAEAQPQSQIGRLNPLGDMLSTCHRIDALADRLGLYAKPPLPTLEHIDLIGPFDVCCEMLHATDGCEVQVERDSSRVSAYTTRIVADTVLRELAAVVPRLEPSRPLRVVARITQDPSRGGPSVELTLLGVRRTNAELADALLPYFRPKGCTHLGIHLALASRVLTRAGGRLTVEHTQAGLTIVAGFLGADHAAVPTTLSNPVPESTG